jgi:4-hydroxy-3-methylbut-2-enyl diphosphate reductase
MGEEKIPTWFIRNQECMESSERIRHFDLAQKREILSETAWLPEGNLHIAITAGASCPNNLIEEVILRLLVLRGESLPTDY